MVEHFSFDRFLVVLDEAKCFKILCGHSGIVVWDAASDERFGRSVIDVQWFSSDAATVQLLVLLLREEAQDSSLCILNIPSKQHWFC